MSLDRFATATPSIIKSHIFLLATLIATVFATLLVTLLANLLAAMIATMLATLHASLGAQDTAAVRQISLKCKGGG